MQVISKSGLKLTLEISGTQEEPVIILSPVAGKPTVKGTCKIAASQKRTGNTPMPADSLFVESAKAFVQLDLALIRAAIAALPAKIYMAKKAVEIIGMDGDRCTVAKWSFEALLVSPKTKEVISSDAMGRFLDGKNLSEIEIQKACQMWADAMETDEKMATARARSDKFHAAQTWAEDMEEMENGLALPEIREG